MTEKAKASLAVLGVFAITAIAITLALVFSPPIPVETLAPSDDYISDTERL